MNRLFAPIPIRILFVVFAGLIGIIGLFIAGRLCTVDTVRIYGDQHVLSNISVLQQKTWLPFVDSVSLARKLTVDNPLAKDIVITKHYPSTLEVTVQKRSPVAAITSNAGYLITDEEGIIIATTPDSALLPIITSDHVTINANHIEESIVLKSIQIISNSVRNGFVVDVITITPENQLITIKFDGGSILFPGNKSIDYLFSSLQLLLPQFRIEGKQLNVLDFRFDKPIIR